MGIHQDFNQRLGVENIISTGQHGRLMLDPYDPYNVIPLPRYDCERVHLKSHPDNSGTFNIGIVDYLTPLNGYPISPGEEVVVEMGFSDSIGVCGELTVGSGGSASITGLNTGLTGMYTGVICWFAEMK